MRISDWSSDVCSSDLHFIEGGGYALRAYDRFKRLTHDPDGTWRVSHPRFVQQHRLNAGIIVDKPVLDVRFANGRKLGTVEEGFAATLRPGDSFFFSRSEEHTSELQSLMRISYAVFCLTQIMYSTIL